MIDTAGCFAAGYTFPDVCHIWQTPGAGEAAVAGWVALDVSTKAALNESLGMTPDVARELADALDDAMGRCILGVYRSTPESVLAQWGGRAQSLATRPGLVLIPTDDAHTGTVDQHRSIAGKPGAEVAALSGLGHWWMLQDPAAAAEVLDRFWEAL